MPCIYDGSKIIPVETFSYREIFSRSEDGTRIGRKFEGAIVGELVAYKGSPTSSGTFWTNTGYPDDETISSDARLKAILNKQEALRCLFSHEGKLLEIYPFDGSAPLKCNPRINSIEFDPGPWFDKCSFTVNIEFDKIYNNLNPDCPGDITPANVEDASEEWQIEASDALNTYRLTHNISAKGKRTYDVAGNLSQEGWKVARDWVLPRLGIDTDRIVASGVLNLPSYYVGYNYVRGENLNEMTGSYSVTETWLISSGNIIEDFTVETRTDTDGKTHVGINGTVTGLETRDNTTWVGPSETKYVAANTQFTNNIQPYLLNRAQSYSGLSLNPEPISKTIGRNPNNGVINYSYDFDDRAASLVPGSKSEAFTISDQNQNDIFAIIPVIGRTAGPVLQSLGAASEKRRTINVEIVMGGALYGSGLSVTPQSVIEPIINQYIPGGSLGPTYSYVRFLEKYEQSWDIINQRYSETVSYVYE